MSDTAAMILLGFMAVFLGVSWATTAVIWHKINGERPTMDDGMAPADDGRGRR